jgi:hypothetical protein
MQICRGLFHVKVNLRAFGKRLPLLTLEEKKRDEKRRMNCVEIECYETYNLWSLLLKRGCCGGKDCRFIKRSILLPNKEMSLSPERFTIFVFYLKTSRTVFIVFVKRLIISRYL